MVLGNLITMPLFRRSDGDPIRDIAPLRYIMPFIWLRRNEATIFHDEDYDVTETRTWLRDYNRAHPDQPTISLFHLFIWACAQGLWKRPGLNRFVMGKRFYQRRGVFITFSAKQSMNDDAPVIAVKLPFPKGESLPDCARRITQAVTDGKGGTAQAVDKELALAKKLPVFLLSIVMAALRWLDSVNLLPKFMIDNDPLYTSLVVSHLGSIGLDRTYHHLYDNGTSPLFAAIGSPRKKQILKRDGQFVVRDVLEVRWTLDDRINDGFYCAQGLKFFKRLIENPAATVE